MTPGSSTLLCAVLGHPVAHSISPAVHNAALQHRGRDAVYLAFDVRPGELGRALEGLKALGAAGANLTVPHKVAALDLVDRVDTDARRIGAANTLVFEGAGPVAHNTDVQGVLFAVRETWPDALGAPWLVLGAGGGGRAAAWAAAEAGSPVLVTNRTRERAAELVGDLTSSGHGAELVAWEERTARAGSVALVIDATSMGMDGGPGPLAEQDLESAAAGGCLGLMDMFYARGETELVRTARRAGLVAADGVQMLVGQAAASYRLWWEEEAPVDIMRAAASEALGRSTADSRPPGLPPLP
ncbi:MAG TPA: shikimate dehydrogenase [Actinomycetota bacterium]|nr:shikimate dehydrogenase [Actinomycetota bacterium]